MYYGPNSEGYHLMSQMMVDFIDKTPDMAKKREYLKKLVLYDDSLQITCNNKKINKKYKKDCDKFIQLADSVQVKYWREYYNQGITSLNSIDQLIEEKGESQDSTFIAKVNARITATVDTTALWYGYSILLDSTDPKPYMGVAMAYEKVSNYPDAIKWLDMALPHAKDSSDLLIQIAYDYIKNDDYCGAIPTLRAYVDKTPTDYNNAYNLSICYNNCKMFDSGLVMNQRVVNSDAPDSKKVDAISSIGRYFNQEARTASDSATADQTAGNEAGAKKWREIRDHYFDSSIVYFKRVIDIKPEDELALEQYSTICALRGKYPEALEGFKKLVVLKPEEADYWRYLGDLNVNQKDFKAAITAYEKVVELKPDDSQVWQQLADLYSEEGMTAKAKAAQKKVDSLK
jgi:tetratricopeptide (TPR) repeat protein